MQHGLPFYLCRIQRRLEVAISQKKVVKERQARERQVANGFGCKIGKALQDVDAGDIGVVVADQSEHYVYITKKLPAYWKKTNRIALEVGTCCSMRNSSLQC
jgi:choline kinase